MVNIAKLVKMELIEIGIPINKVVEMKNELSNFLKSNYLKAKDFSINELKNLYKEYKICKEYNESVIKNQNEKIVEEITEDNIEERLNEICFICMDAKKEEVICQTCNNLTCSKCYSIICNDRINAKCPFCRTIIFEEENKRKAELQEYFVIWNNRIDGILSGYTMREVLNRIEQYHNKRIEKKNV